MVGRFFVHGPDDTSRHSHHCCPCRYIFDNNGVGADAGALVQRDRTQDLRAGTDNHIIGQSRVTFALFPTGPAEGDAVIQGTVIAYLGSLADHDTHSVINKKTPSDIRARMDLDPGQPAGNRGYPACKPFPLNLPQAMGEPVKQHGVHTRIGRQDFKTRACRGVACKDAIDIFF